MRHRCVFVVSVVVGCGLGKAEDGLRLPSGSTATVTTSRGGKTVRYPFGTVDIPQDAVWNGKTEVVPLGKLHAKTQGSFRLAYVLGREGGRIVARSVRVTVENKEKYLSPVTPKLREHEAMHRRINEAEALRIQEALAAFQTEETDPAKAERRFKEEFHRQIAAVKKLHAQWDENHVFLHPSAEGNP